MRRSLISYLKVVSPFTYNSLWFIVFGVNEEVPKGGNVSKPGVSTQGAEGRP